MLLVKKFLNEFNIKKPGLINVGRRGTTAGNTQHHNKKMPTSVLHVGIK